MNNKTITFISDFGEDFAKGQVETVIHSIDPQIRFITVSNVVTPFSILEGSFLLTKFYGFSPKGSVHLVVVDPGVGSNRRGIIIKTKNYFFVGPDNGVLFAAVQDDGIKKAYVIKEKNLGTFSNTFHGRDIFAKVAAFLADGKDPSEFAEEIDLASLIPFIPEENQVAHIDAYGNIKVNNSCETLQIGDQVKVETPHLTEALPFCKTFADVLEGELLLYKGSHNTLEIAQNLGSANALLNLKVGDVLQIEKL